MVAIVAVHQPELGNVAELNILCDLLGHEVAMVIYDGHTFGVPVIKLTGCAVGKHEVFIDKLFHISYCGILSYKNKGRSR